MDNIHENFQPIEVPVVKKLYELYQKTHMLTLKFPKHERYTFGEKLENNILEAIELIVMGNAQAKNFKDPYLLKANSKVEVLKILFRLGFDTAVVSESDYLKAEEYLQEIGKMLGGWIKYLRSN
jgi:hypothetical protein